MHSHYTLKQSSSDTRIYHLDETKTLNKKRLVDLNTQQINFLGKNRITILQFNDGTQVNQSISLPINMVETLRLKNAAGRIMEAVSSLLRARCSTILCKFSIEILRDESTKTLKPEKKNKLEKKKYRERNRDYGVTPSASKIRWRDGRP